MYVHTCILCIFTQNCYIYPNKYTLFVVQCGSKAEHLFLLFTVFVSKFFFKFFFYFIFSTFAYFLNIFFLLLFLKRAHLFLWVKTHVQKILLFLFKSYIRRATLFKIFFFYFIHSTISIRHYKIIIVVVTIQHTSLIGSYDVWWLNKIYGKKNRKEFSICFSNRHAGCLNKIWIFF